MCGGSLSREAADRDLSSVREERLLALVGVAKLPPDSLVVLLWLLLLFLLLLLMELVETVRA